MPELDLAIPRTRLDRIRQGATVIPTEPAVFRFTGPGALTCLQGLLTNDLVKPGGGSIVYGALLTPKGMIVVDAWVLRADRDDVLTMIVPPGGREAAIELFRRSIPPRLARVENLSDEWRVAWLVGGHAFHTLAQTELPMPESAGRVIAAGASDALIALAPETAPFVALFAGPAAEVASLAGAVVTAGAREGDETDWHAARILGGWPALGVEIDERTLPQEVRYDEIGGVSYTKGCYTGQETVARLHFRGHTNRELRGLVWNEEPPEGRAVVANGKEVGTVRSTLKLGDRTLGLALLRREIEPGGAVVAGGRQATVVPLPFALETLEVGA